MRDDQLHDFHAPYQNDRFWRGVWGSRLLLVSLCLWAGYALGWAFNYMGFVP